MGIKGARVYSNALKQGIVRRLEGVSVWPRSPRRPGSIPSCCTTGGLSTGGWG